MDKKKKAPPEGVNRQHINVSRVTFNCAVWCVFWKTTCSKMWRCKMRQVGYYMHKFITNMTKKNYHSVFSTLIVMVFLVGRSVSGVVRKFECPLKNAAFLPMQ